MIGTIIKRGLAAGAAGVTALNAVTYLDMALRGRGTSEAPEQTVDALSDALGADIPGRGAVRSNRLTALGALGGIGTGLAVGLAESVARAAGFRLPAPLGAVATGAAAMAGSDVPMAVLGVSDPRTWSASSWASDAVPHLAYGIATRSVVNAQSTPEERARDADAQPPSAGLLLRSGLLGLATGGRSSFGLAGPALTSPHPHPILTGTAVLAAGGELVMDKLPSTPRRTDPPGLPMRLVSGAGGSVALAGREDAAPTWPALVGALGAAAGSFAGLAWRDWAKGRFPDWQAALAEDGLSILLAGLACVPGGGRSARHRPTYAELVNAH